MDATHLNRFCLVTGLQQEEIISTLEYLPLTTEQALNFYMFFNRWPSDNEASFIADVGWQFFEDMIDTGVHLDLGFSC